MVSIPLSFGVAVCSLSQIGLLLTVTTVGLLCYSPELPFNKVAADLSCHHVDHIIKLSQITSNKMILLSSPRSCEYNDEWKLGIWS